LPKRRITVKGVRRRDVSPEDIAQVYWLMAKRQVRERREKAEQERKRREELKRER
jgi:hypothetical protein